MRYRKAAKCCLSTDLNDDAQITDEGNVVAPATMGDVTASKTAVPIVQVVCAVASFTPTFQLSFVF